MRPERGRDQLRRLVPLALVLSAATVSAVVVALLLIETGDMGADALFADVYELAGSRMAGLISFIGVVLFVASAAICLFTAGITWTDPGTGRWSHVLLGAGLLTAALALDDYLSIHELADDVLTASTGIEAGRALKNLLELGVLSVYGLLFIVFLWHFRSAIVSTEWVLLGAAGGLLLTSLMLDVAPHSWLADTVGFSLGAQAVVEDTLKLAGIVFYTTYLVRTSARVARSLAR